MALRDMQTIKEGAVFNRRGQGPAVEYARVIGVGEDRMGIPHVRFELQVRRHGVPSGIECRTLALDVFCSRYRERVTR